MNYFELTDIDDALLKPLITEKVMQDASEEIESIAAKLGVTAGKISATINRDVKMCAIAYACYRAALNNAGASINKFMNDGKDSYEKKASVYEKEYEKRKSQLTAEMFTGEANTPVGYTPVIRLYRA